MFFLSKHRASGCKKALKSVNKETERALDKLQCNKTPQESIESWKNNKQDGVIDKSKNPFLAAKHNVSYRLLHLQADCNIL